MDDAASTPAARTVQLPAHRMRFPPPTRETARPSASQQPDTVELSPEARRMSEAAQTSETEATEPAVRTELVERVRNEIEAGTYETEQKLDQALEAVLDRLETETEEERAETE